MASFYAGNIVGHTLGTRYRLLNLIGMGASARVYLAEDTKLRRRVAVKLLHASLAGDESFLRRFQREAESLAPLTHPNIVIIHDVNDRQNANGEPPYLVTEYLSGGSLRNLLDWGSPITPAQAAVVGLGAARGLVFAHAHNVVHRDIKPANLLFGDDQRVRIGDFGLARALADYGRTEPAGALVGTAKYLSPEQAKGTAHLDGRSDVYSLALVLYEAVSGEVPFTTDTWQGTAMARLHDDLHCPAEFGPLGSVLEAAGTVDPTQRLDAEGLVVALEAVARELPRPEPLLLDGSRVLDRAAQLDERDPTLFAVGTRKGSVALDDFTALAPSSIGTKLAEPFPVLRNGSVMVPTPGANGTAAEAAPFGTVGDGGVGNDGGGGFGGGAPGSGSGTAGSPPETAVVPSTDAGSVPGTTSKAAAPAAAKAEAKAERKRATSEPKKRSTTNRRTKIVAGIVGVAVLGATAAGVVIARRTPTHIVPNIVGMTIGAGQADVDNEKFTVVTLAPEFNADTPSGQIIRQSPEPGQRLKERETITVVASKGVQPVSVPDLAGRTVEVAVAALEAVGLRSSNPPQFRVDDNVEAGRVIAWTPTGAVAPKSLVTLVVSSGPAAVALPRLRGLTINGAVAQLPDGVTSTIIEIFSDTKAGLVSSSEPKAGSMVRRGDTVKIFVSKGPDLITVPNIINQSPAAAATALRAAGFAVGNTIGPADQPVLHTRPLRNTKARRGTKVTLYTTDAGVPEVPGVAATRNSGSAAASSSPGPSTTALVRQLSPTPAEVDPTTAP